MAAGGAVIKAAAACQCMHFFFPAFCHRQTWVRTLLQY